MAANLRFPPLPSIRDILKLYRLQARKQLAQNFLMDERLINKIIRQAGCIKGSQIIEVGPGPGGLTRSIMKKLPDKLIVIEKDYRFKPTLEMLAETFETINGKMDIIFDDILKTNLSSKLTNDYKKEWNDKYPKIQIIGNLPFNVSTPLIIHWLNDISNKNGAWSMGRVKLLLTFQKEVAERIVAPPLNEQRCRLSLMSQAWTNPRLRFIIPGKAFVPPPDVDVGVVTFEPLITPRTTHNFKLFEKISRHLFSFRQKYSRACIKTLFPPNISEDMTMMMFKLSDLDPTMRPVQFSVEDVDKLCTAYKYLTENNPGLENYNYRASRKVLGKNQAVGIQISDYNDDDGDDDDYLLPSEQFDNNTEKKIQDNIS